MQADKNYQTNGSLVSGNLETLNFCSTGDDGKDNVMTRMTLLKKDSSQKLTGADS